MSKELTYALNARAALTQMRQKLAEAGVDITGVKYLTDVPAVLATILPEDLTEVFPPELATLAEALLSNEEALEQVYHAFSGIAGSGLLSQLIARPED